MVDITVKDWCELFLTCFQSPVLKRRCLKDFYFYSRLFLQPPRPQAFTFEIGTYISATRIQVNYCRYWYHHYRFIVNIIHCDSAGTYNGSGTYLMFGYDFLHKNSCCSVLLGVVGQSLKPSNFFSQRLPTFCSEASCNNVGSVSTTLQTLLGPLTRITHVYKVLWVVFFPQCTAGPNIVWSCRIRFLTISTRTQQLLPLLAPQC